MTAFWLGRSPFLRVSETSTRWPTGMRLGSFSAAISTRLGQVLLAKGAERRGGPIFTNGGRRREMAIRSAIAPAAVEREYQTGLVTRAFERSVDCARWVASLT